MYKVLINIRKCKNIVFNRIDIKVNTIVVKSTCTVYSITVVVNTTHDEYTYIEFINTAGALQETALMFSLFLYHTILYWLGIYYISNVK